MERMHSAPVRTVSPIDKPINGAKGTQCTRKCINRLYFCPKCLITPVFLRKRSQLSKYVSHAKLNYLLCITRVLGGGPTLSSTISVVEWLGSPMKKTDLNG